MGTKDNRTTEEIIQSTQKRLNAAIRKVFKDDVQDIEITELSSENENAIINFNVSDCAKVSCTIKPNRLAIVRSESEPEGMDQQDLDALGSEIAEKVSGRKTTYDGILTIMKVVSFSRAADKGEDPERMVYNEVMSFIQNIVAYKAKLKGDVSAIVEDSNGNDMVDDDPFGFDSVMDEDEENDNQSEAEESKEGLKEEESAKDDATESVAEPDEQQEPIAESDDAVIDMPVMEGEPADEYVPKRAGDDAKEDAQEDATAKGDKTEKLKELLDSIDNDEPLEPAPELTIPSLGKKDESSKQMIIHAPNVDESEMVDTQEAQEKVEGWQEYDQFGLIQNAQQYKEAAKGIIAQIKDLLESIYGPACQLSLDLYERSGELAISERKAREAIEAMRAKDASLDEERRSIDEQKTSLAKDRTVLDADMAKVQQILADYDAKCNTVAEQTEQIRRMSKHLTEDQDTIDRLNSELEAARTGASTTESGEKADPEYVAALVKITEDQKAYIEKITERLKKHTDLTATFKETQAAWEAREQEYKDKIAEMEAHPVVSTEELDSAKGKIAGYEKVIEEQKKQIADKEETVAQKSKSVEEAEKRAEEAEKKAEQVRSEAAENEKKVTELDNRIAELEDQLATEKRKTDIVHNANEISNVFESIGIKLDVIPGDSEMMLGAKHENCQIVVDIESCIIFVKKEVKKAASKYAKQIESLNQTDIRTGYTIGTNEISCRSIYTDINSVANQINSILKEMNTFI